VAGSASDQESRLERYFEALQAAFAATAAALGGPLAHDCAIAGHPVRLRFASAALAAQFTPAMAHLQRASGAGAPLDIVIWDQPGAGAAMPAPPWSWQDYMSRGEIGGLESAPESTPESTPGGGRFRAWYHVASGILNMIDLAGGRALQWVRDPAQLPMYVTAAPLRLPLQAWLSRDGLHFAHAAAVGTAAGAVLLAGAGGAGKSTTSLACLHAGMEFIGDDYCLIAAEPSPRVHSVYCSAKVDAAMLGRLPRLAPAVQRREDPPGEKKLLLLQTHFGGQLAPSLPLRALLAPVRCDQQESTLEPVKALTAIRALAPSTMEQISGPDASAWKTITALARQLPCYRLRLGRDLDSAPAVIRRLLDALA
jgi:hypothetical protein